ncbi:MAG: aminomethyl transferase family protein [Planctomycetes bacterium]|nr:aminomethyl transferase family protein [Planctomycetota bacterium]
MAERFKTPLHDRHLQLGATLAEYQGWLIPGHYGRPEEEYQAIRTGAALSDRSFRARLLFTGKDCVDYLQRMTSNDVLRMEPGRGCLDTLLTDRGKTIAVFRLYRFEDGVRADLDPAAKAAALAPLEKFIIMDDVKITDESDTTGVLGVYGPSSGSLLASAFRLDIPPLEEFQHFPVYFAGEDLHVSRHHWTGEEGYEIEARTAKLGALWDTLAAAAPAHRGRPVGHQALDVARIEAGIPVHGIDLDENTIPLEAGLDSAVSVKKGCYVGQEIIARIHHLGHINRRLAGLRWTGESMPRPGDEVRDAEKKVGILTSAARSPALGCGIGLSILRRESLEPGRPLTLSSASGNVSAQVAPLPFVSHVRQ